ncbi:hypothetical protein [Streptomyces sp. NPDC003077]|uniref:hypothetical protein n=1 Tax=Streptomyces sp. NPDC003077 TaxID=3154443 RepID=UPI0033BA9198
MSAERPARLATFLFRRYLYASAVGCREHGIPLAGGRPEAAPSEARRLDALPPRHPARPHRPGGP